ncbi:hypothetical protein GYMLUDRAFT_51368 [Collybiopsis luxurians FD-317 M1]|uniref:PLAC8-domain-containing protein n=1 Tax=Collybiopsis luxurians FD-317 M1 TaxID=944289 RepID=A0A0D0BX93_9AGAR|nr:hypothetical protein GYMLUDRAFT_51368 [Collybiopsis luxurians FD-317 M1]
MIIDNRPDEVTESTGKQNSNPPGYSLHAEAGSSSNARLISRHERNDPSMSYPPQAAAPDSGAFAASQATISSQPLRKDRMTEIVGSRNGRKMPVDLRGKRDWSSSLCGCFMGGDDEMDTCCTACCCPCVVFARNKTRIDHLANHRLPEPEGGTTGGTCAVYALMTLLFGIAGCAMQVPLRGTIRDRYSIAGTALGDMCTSLCCYSCALTQEHIEISAEEHSFPRGVGGSSGVYYDDPNRYQV